MAATRRTSRPTARRTAPGRAAVTPSPSVPSNGAAEPAWRTDELLRRVEVVAWLLVAFVAFATRLLNLDGAPLQPQEASLAVAAWNLLQRLDFSAAAASPLLVYGNVLSFMLLGASDAVARGIPCLAGIFVALSPFFARRELGRIGALGAAATLAVSPTLVLASRTLDPAMPTIALGIAIVLALAAYQRAQRARSLALVGVMLALLLMAGPLAFDVLLILGGFVLVYHLERRAPRTLPSDALGLTPEATSLLPPSSDSAIVAASGPALRAALIAFAVAAALVWTGLATNLDGLGGSVALPFGAWAKSFAGLSPGAIWTFPTILVAYEPLALVFGIVGAWVGYRRERLFDSFLVWAAVVGFALLVASDGLQPLWAALVIVPLGYLTGVAIEQIGLGLAQPGAGRRLAIFAPITLSLVATTMIAAGNASLPDPSVPRYVAVAPPLALLTFVVFFATYFDLRSALLSAATIAAVGLFAFGVHAALVLSPGGALAPDVIFHPTATSPDVRTLASDTSLILDELHLGRTVQGLPVTEDVQVVAPYAEPLQWYLRQASNLRVVSSVEGQPSIAILGSNDKAPSGPYAGETFQLTQTAGPPMADPADLWRWLIYRQSPGPTPTNVKVFVKSQLGRR